MTDDLVEKVARAFIGEDGLPLWEYHKRQARAAIAVVLKDMDLWETNNCSSFHARDYARDNGIKL